MKNEHSILLYYYSNKHNNKHNNRYIIMNTIPRKLLTNISNRYSLSNFRQNLSITYDTWNKIDCGKYTIKFYRNSNNQEIGHISYKLYTGQIGLFYIDDKYRNNGLGKQILLQTINHMKDNNINYVWVVSLPQHSFWSNVFNKTFVFHDFNKLHPSVTGCGYKLDLTKFNLNQFQILNFNKIS